MAIALLSLPLLHGCGGGGSDGGDGSVRLVNLADGYDTLDFYANETEISEGVASGAAGSYASLGSGGYTFKLKRGGSSTTSGSTIRTVNSGVSYSMVAYATSDTLRGVLLTESEEAPSAGEAKLRIYNGSVEAGPVDIYITDPSDTTFDNGTVVATGLATERVSGYNEVTAATAGTTYRVRVTGTGDKTDIRLDLPAVTLKDQQITTLVLTSTTGGVLVHAGTVDQKGSVAVLRNTSARVRLLAGANAAGNGNGTTTVSATVNGVALSSAGVQSPAVGLYTLVPAGTLTLNATVNGTNAPTSATTLAAGSDYSLLVAGDPSSPTSTLISDDNKPALSTTKAKMRLINGYFGSSPMTLTSGGILVATDVGFRAATTPALVAAGTGIEILASSSSNPSLMDKVDQTITATGVYTVVILGGAATDTGVSIPTGYFLRDR